MATDAGRWDRVGPRPQGRRASLPPSHRAAAFRVLLGVTLVVGAASAPAQERIATPGPAQSTRAVPEGFVPWWQKPLAQPLTPESHGVPVAPDGLVLAALAHSAQIRVFRDSVVIRQSAIGEADGKFDVRAFAESKYRNTSDPVGSTLTTGGPNRWLDSNWYASAGVRKRLDSGADVEISQKIGYEDSNSLYFVPPYQGTSRFGVTFTQPLLNGASAAYTKSVIVLADLDAHVAQDRFAKDLQTLLLDIHRAYWDLYLQRAALVQRSRLYSQAVAIRDELFARRGVDVLQGQIVRAEAAVANREAALIRYRAAMHNTESRLRAMVNDPGLATSDTQEMIPQQVPIRCRVPADLNGSLVTALRFRPEIQQGMKEIRTAGVRSSAAENEVLPVLNAVLETYVSGLRGQGNIAQAYADQFSLGRPSYAGGLQFEMPLGGNRTASARLFQRRVELRQATCQLEATTANIRAEVEIAVRDVDTAFREMVSKYHAIIACDAEIQYLTARWRALPGDQQSAGFVLDELLNSQERLAQAELDFATAEAAYNVALIGLTRATGTLVDTQDIGSILASDSGVAAPVSMPAIAYPQPAAIPQPSMPTAFKYAMPPPPAAVMQPMPTPAVMQPAPTPAVPQPTPATDGFAPPAPLMDAVPDDPPAAPPQRLPPVR